MRKVVLAAAFAGATGLLTGCATPPAETPPPPVPPLQAEVIPKPPVTATPLIWQPGHWDWNGAAYVWTPGQYIPRDGHGNLYMPGYWSKTTQGWAWQPAHWL